MERSNTKLWIKHRVAYDKLRALDVLHTTKNQQKFKQQYIAYFALNTDKAFTNKLQGITSMTPSQKLYVERLFKKYGVEDPFE